MRRFLYFVGFLLLLGLLAYASQSWVERRPGWYPLAVHFSVTGEPPARLICDTVRKRVVSRDGQDRPLFAPSFRGRPQIVAIHIVRRESPIFGELSGDPREERFVRVQWEMADGRRAEKVVPIPDDFETVREMTVKIP